MSWIGGTYTFDYSMPKDKINSEVFDLLVNQNSTWEYSGHWDNIRFVSVTPYKSYNEALSAISKYQRDCRDNTAVPYWDFDEKISAKLKEYDERIAKAHERFEKALADRWLPTISSRFVTCRTCGSSLSREHLLSREMQGRYYDHCPVCSGDLRPKSMKDRVDSLRNNWLKAKEAKAEEELKLTEKFMSNPEKYGKKMWLVEAAAYIG